MKKQLSFLILCVFTALFVSCSKGQKRNGLKKAGKATIILKNIKDFDTLYTGVKAIDVENPSMTLTIPDSLHIFTETFTNKTPETKTYSYYLNDDEFMSATLNITRDEYTVFLEPGDTVEISVGDKGNIKKALYNGKENDPALTYVTQKFPNFVGEYIKEMAKDSANFSPEAFSKIYIGKVNALIKEKQAMAKKELAAHNISENIAFAIEEHGNFIKDAMEQKNSGYKWNDKAMGLIMYRGLPDNYFYERSQGTESDIKTLLTKNYDEVLNDKNIPPKTKNLLFKTLIEIMGKSAPTLVKPSIAKIPNKELRDSFDKLYSEKFLLNLNDFKFDKDKINLAAFQKTASKDIFTYKQLLEKHKGKVIYLDLWASWCKPCRAEMPASHRLREELKNEPIAFVYLSVDDSYNDWANAVIEEKITENPNSLLILNSRSSELYKSWNVTGIPRFMIIDKTGKVVNTNASRPSDAKTKDELLKFAKK